METTVYRLGSDSRRIIEDFPNYLIGVQQMPGALACGVLHWIAESRGLNYGSSNCLVAAFDLVTERHMIVALPNLPEFKVTSMLVSELGGRLSTVFNYDNVGVVDVWVMKDYGVTESWTKLLTLSCSDINKIIVWVIPLAYGQSGDEVLLMLNCDTLMWYNLEKKTSKFVDVLRLSRFFYAAVWLESLVSLGKKAKKDKFQD